MPNAPALTTRQIIDLIAEELGSPIKVNVAPILLLRVMGLFNKTVHEVDEMVYEFTQPFVIDGTKAESQLGIAPTPMTDSVAATVAWFRDRRRAG